MKSNIRTISRAGAALATAAIVILAAAPAYAANVTSSFYPGRASFNPADSFWYEVCDLQPDGHGVYGKFMTEDAMRNRTYQYIWDGNGSSSGCQNGHGFAKSSTAVYVTVEACIDNTGVAGSVGGSDGCATAKGWLK